MKLELKEEERRRLVRARCQYMMLSSTRRELERVQRSAMKASGGSYEAREAQAKALVRRETNRWTQYEREARRIMDKMPPKLYTFCLYYCLNGLSVQEAADRMGVCERTGWSYKKKIFGGRPSQAMAAADAEDGQSGSRQAG